MTTIINNPGGETASESGAGIIVGAVIALILITLFIIYGLPALRSNPQQAEQKDTTNINVTVPVITPVPSSTTN